MELDRFKAKKQTKINLLGKLSKFSWCSQVMLHDKLAGSAFIIADFYIKLMNLYDGM